MCICIHTENRKQKNMEKTNLIQFFQKNFDFNRDSDIINPIWIGKYTSITWILVNMSSDWIKKNMPNWWISKNMSLEWVNKNMPPGWVKKHDKSEWVNKNMLVKGKKKNPLYIAMTTNFTKKMVKGMFI